MPLDGYLPCAGRECAVLCGVGGQLMEDHCHCSAGFRAQDNLGAADLGIVGCGIRCQLVPNELCQRYSLPRTGAQQLLCCCHRANASVECRYEIGNRFTPNRSLGNDGADSREGVLDTVVELRNQDTLALLCSLALGDIDVNANHSLCAPIAII